MTLDGFDPGQKQAFQAYSPDTAARFYEGIEKVATRLGVHVEGMEHVPKGRALLVANHAFGFDIALPLAALWRAQGRHVWVLGEHVWWQLPFVRRLAAAIGIVDGTPENVDCLLANDQLVLVLPGGLREAVKPRQLRYQLLWGQRYGFVRAAIRNQAPMVPLASVGADELFNFVGDAYARGTRWLGDHNIPIPFPRSVLPIPHLVPLRFAFGEPVPCTVEPEQASNMEAVRRLRHEVEGALHELIERELAKRLGVDND